MAKCKRLPEGITDYQGKTLTIVSIAINSLELLTMIPKYSKVSIAIVLPTNHLINDSTSNSI